MRLGELASYCPDSGDIIWLDLLQVVGSEQAGRRLRWSSRRAFNEHRSMRRLPDWHGLDQERRAAKG